MLGRDVLVAERLRLVLGFVEDLVELARHRGLRVALLRVALDLARDLLAQRRHARAELLEDGNDDALVLLEERAEQVEVVDDRIADSARGVDRFVERLAGLHGELFWIDHAGSVQQRRCLWRRAKAADSLQATSDQAAPCACCRFDRRLLDANKTRAESDRLSARVLF